MELLKNFVASIPIGLAVGLTYTIQPVLFIAKQLSLLGIFLHESMGTKLGQNITAKKAEIKKAVAQMELLAKQMEAAAQRQNASNDEGENRLASIIKGANQNSNAGAQVFVLGKKDDGNGSQN